jgi:integrase
MANKREHGEGSVQARGTNTFRLRYRIRGQRFEKTFHGTQVEARRELRRLLKSGDDGDHIVPSTVTLSEWIERWFELLKRETGGGERRRGLVTPRTRERYEQLLRHHVIPTLGSRSLQQLQAVEVDKLYLTLERKLAPRTCHHVHTVLNAAIKAAMRKGLLSVNPVARAEAPSPGESDHGMALDEKQLGVLLDGFRSSSLFPIIAVLAFTGMRRGEALALRWRDLDIAQRTLRIERAVEQTSEFGLAIKEPKTSRGKRTITIDDDLIELLVAERDQHLRIKAGVPDGVRIDLSLVKLPEDALMFPGPPGPGEDFSFTRLRRPDNTTKEFLRRAHLLGFKKLRLHDLRGGHETLLLDQGVPVHVVAARCGHDAAVLLRSYAKRSKKADTSAAAIIGAITKGVLRR